MNRLKKAFFFFLSFIPMLYSQSMFIDAPDAKLFCRTMGAGPPLIILHGGPGLSHEYLLPHMTELARDRFLIFYDQRGSGLSTEGNSLELDAFISDLNAIYVHFDLPRVSLLGHSWGAYLALQYAMRYPEKVERLILLNPIPASSEGFSLYLREYERRIEPFKELLEEIQKTEAFRAGDPRQMARYLEVNFWTHCAQPEHASHLNLHMSVEANLNFIKTSQVTLLPDEFDLAEELQKLSQNVVIIHGECDLIPISAAEHIHSCLKNSKLISIPECGHFPFVEKPEEFFKILASELR